MPRKGPKKVTARDERDSERDKAKHDSIAAKAQKRYDTEVLKALTNKSNPNIPTTKVEKKALRRALERKGETLERWGVKHEEGEAIMDPSCVSTGDSARAYKQNVETEFWVG
jgi:hypothetical protein